MFKWIRKHWGKILICVTFLALFASLIIFGSIPGLATAAIGTTILGVAFPTALTTASTFIQTMVLSAIITAATPIIVGALMGIAFGFKAICDCFSSCCGRRNPDQLRQQIDEEIQTHNATQQQQQVSDMLNADGNNNEPNWRNPGYTRLYQQPPQQTESSLIVDINDPNNFSIV